MTDKSKVLLPHKGIRLFLYLLFQIKSETCHGDPFDHIGNRFSMICFEYSVLFIFCYEIWGKRTNGSSDGKRLLSSIDPTTSEFVFLDYFVTSCTSKHLKEEQTGVNKA